MSLSEDGEQLGLLSGVVGMVELSTELEDSESPMEAADIILVWVWIYDDVEERETGKEKEKETSYIKNVVLILTKS